MKFRDLNENYPNLTRDVLAAVEKAARDTQYGMQRDIPERMAHKEADAMLGFFLGIALLNGVNGGQNEAIADGINLAFESEHRTLQQSAFRAIMHFIRSYAETEDRFTDARNESSVAMARKIAECTSHMGLPLI